MKNDYLRWIAVFLLICFVFGLAFYLNRNYAYADALTISAISGISYALMNNWGISLSSVNSDSTGVKDFMTGQLTNYVNSHGGSIANLFGTELARIELGKLVVGYQLYNGVKDFISWMTEQFNFGNSDSLLYAQTNDFTVNGNIVQGITGSTQPDANIGLGAAFWNITQQGDKTLYRNIGVFSDQVYIFTGNLSGYNTYTSNYFFKISNNQLVCCAECYNYRTLQEWTNNYVLSGIVALSNLNWNGENYVEPTVLNPTQGWEGTIGGQEWPDTNLDELIGSVFEDVADNNLDVDGEVIDVPIPPPTPAPIAPDTPLSDVPWEGLDNNLTDLYNQGLEEIGAIGDAQDAITDAVEEQTGALQGAIAGNAGVVSGAIDQAVSDIQDAISEQTQTLSESSSATAEATETIAEALEDESINWQKYDLRGLFPFCIPFDIYNMLEALDASPTAPHVQLPFVIESIGFSYTIDLDFSAFDQVAAVMRQMELIVYGIALAWATSKVIKW